MNHHIDHKHEVVFYWPSKCGVTSVLELILLLTEDKVIAYPGEDWLVHDYYNELRWGSGVFLDQDLSNVPSNYRRVLFSRNPYHRIVSGFLDKFVCSGSPGIDDSLFDGETFSQFVKFLYYHGFGEGDFDHHFSPCFLKRREFDIILDTPSTALPEGKIPMDFFKASKILRLLDRLDLQQGLRVLTSGPQGIESWNCYSSRLTMSEDPFHDALIQDLLPYMTYKTNRSIPYENFYTEELKQQLRSIYLREFAFYESVGVYYDI
jgi:hypothetical protein